MSNKINKPKKTAAMLVQKMKDELGITFKYADEAEAQVYLSDVNNYLRTASYRKNYQKVQFTELSGRCSVFERPLSDAKRPLIFN